MARLIVLDASVAIAALSSDDAHHRAATAALTAAAGEDEFVLAATTRVEILVGPARAGGDALAKAKDFVDGCATVPIGVAVADGAAVLRARHRALSVPDAIAIALTDLLDADQLWTFDRRWLQVDRRAALPSS